MPMETTGHPPVESSGFSRGNPRLYEMVEKAPKTGKSPTIWAFPEVMEWFKVAGQPVPGPHPPHQRPRPDPEEEALPVAVAETRRPTPPPPAREDEEESSPSRYHRVNPLTGR